MHEIEINSSYQNEKIVYWFDEFGNQLIETKSWNMHQITEEMATSLYEALDVTESDVFLESIEARLAMISYLKSLHENWKSSVKVSWKSHSIIWYHDEYLKYWNCIVIGDLYTSIWNFTKDPTSEKYQLNWHWTLLYNDWWIYVWNFKEWKFSWQWILRKNNWQIAKWNFEGFKLNWEWEMTRPNWDRYIWYFKEWLLETWKLIQEDWTEQSIESWRKVKTAFWESVKSALNKKYN